MNDANNHNYRQKTLTSQFKLWIFFYILQIIYNIYFINTMLIDYAYYSNNGLRENSELILILGILIGITGGLVAVCSVIVVGNFVYERRQKVCIQCNRRNSYKAIYCNACGIKFE